MKSCSLVVNDVRKLERRLARVKGSRVKRCAQHRHEEMAGDHEEAAPPIGQRGRWKNVADE